ncbi:MAG: hypothetical protein QM703_14680 [Gemmatales bacterium]
MNRSYFQRSRVRYHRFAAILVLGLGLLCASCGKKEAARLPVYPVHGKILVDGKPVEKVMVVLHPLDGLDLQGAPKPFAKTNADGSYNLSTYDPQDGAPAGKYAVLIYWFRNDPDDDGNTDRFQKRYGNPAAPVMKVDITPGVNSLKTLDVK